MRKGRINYGGQSSECGGGEWLHKEGPSWVLLLVLGCSLSMPFGSHLQCLKKTRLSLSSYAKNKEPAWKDVTLYYYNRQKFFRLVGLACASQFIFWGWMAYILISLKQERSQKKILDVSSSSLNPGVSWKIARFVMVSINQHDIHLHDN